jgi:imidazoleglycerol-phosphate dehydratase
MSKGAPQVRYAEVERETTETRVTVVLDLDGGSRRDVTTGISFFDHMLQLFAYHGQMNIGIQAVGDIHVDDHHTVEDVGIVLGKAIRQCLEESDPIARYASVHQVMDEALVLVAIDISGRGQFHHDLSFARPTVGSLATENVREFFRALSQHAGITIHIRKIAGDNDHHVIEACFKGFGRALREAVTYSDRAGNSTKGKLD